MSWTRLLLPLLVVAGAPAPAAAQEVIPDRVTCGDCRLDLTEVRRLGDRLDDVLYDAVMPWLVEDEAGRVWIPNFGGSTGAMIQVYSPDGSYVDFGREGQGPGEFRMTNLLACIEDRILHLDMDRFSIIDPSRDEMQYAFRNPGVGDQGATNAIQLSDSLVWIASPSRHPDYLGYPIVVLDVVNGEIVHAYGKEVEHYDRDVERSLRRYLVRLDVGRIASVGWSAYEIRIRASDGRLLRHFVRDAPWFRPGAPPEEIHIGAAVAIDPHTLAVFINQRDPDAPVVVEGPDDRTASEKWNAIIEVIDLRQGQVLARVRRPHFVLGTTCPTNRVAFRALDARLPVDHLRLYDLELTGRR